MLSNESKCIKSPWYERSLPLVNLHMVRDKAKHDNRRKVFSKAFSPAALQDYENRVVVHCAEFVKQMTAMAGQPFDASEWCKYFGGYPPTADGQRKLTEQRSMSWAISAWARSST